MKKRITSLLLALALALSLAGTALAAEVSNDKATITSKDGATATFDTSNPDIIKVTFTSDSLVNGNQYLVLMVKGTEGTYEINESSILYIDQKAAENGSISFDVYPKNLASSVILITGVNGGPLVAAIVDAKYILGDLDGNGSIESADAIIFNQCLAGILKVSETDTAYLAGDINKDGSLDALDIVVFNQFLAGIIQMLA